MTDGRAWVTDTSVYTHLSRAGHLKLLEQLAPGGVLLVPDDVNSEIQNGRATYEGIEDPSTLSWVKLAVLEEEEEFISLQVKAAMGGAPEEHLGECAVVACAKHRGLVALLDERRAITQAELRGVTSRDTLWLVIEAYVTIFEYDRDRAAAVVDDLLETGMYLPPELQSGASLIAWAYEQGLLPRDPSA